MPLKWFRREVGKAEELFGILNELQLEEPKPRNAGFSMRKGP